MKIRKVDDKPMVIHTKQKVEIHTHEPKQASIKGNNIYMVERGTAKETAKTTAKVAAKTATKTAATAAGTAVAPGVGTAIGMAAGYAAGVSIEVKDEKMTKRSRKIKFFLDKMKAQENQTDSVAKLVKDLIVRKAITWVKAAAQIVGLVLLLPVLVVAMIAVPVIAAIAILYNLWKKTKAITMTSWQSIWSSMVSEILQQS